MEKIKKNGLITEPLKNDEIHENNEQPQKPYVAIRRPGREEVDIGNHVFQRFRKRLTAYLFGAATLAATQANCGSDEKCNAEAQKYCDAIAAKLNMDHDPNKCLVQTGNLFQSGFSPLICGFEKKPHENPKIIEPTEKCDARNEKDCSEDKKATCIQFPDVKDPQGNKGSICLLVGWPNNNENSSPENITENRIDGGTPEKNSEQIRESIREEISRSPNAPLCEDNIDQPKHSYAPEDSQIYLDSDDKDFITCSQKISEPSCLIQSPLPGSVLVNGDRITIIKISQEDCNRLADSAQFLTYFMFVKKNSQSAFAITLRKSHDTALDTSSLTFDQGIFTKNGTISEKITSLDPNSFVSGKITVVRFPESTYPDHRAWRAANIFCRTSRNDAQGCVYKFTLRIKPL